MSPAPPIARCGPVLAHTTNLKVVYTNDSTLVGGYLSDFKKWIGEARDQEKFIGLDFEYTANQQEVAVIQLCFKKYVLVFQWARYKNLIQKLYFGQFFFNLLIVDQYI